MELSFICRCVLGIPQRAIVFLWSTLLYIEGHLNDIGLSVCYVIGVLLLRLRCRHFEKICLIVSFVVIRNDQESDFLSPVVKGLLVAELLRDRKIQKLE